MDEPEEGELVEKGPIRVDKGNMGKKLAVDDKKLLGHRMNLILKEFPVIVYGAGASAIMAPGALYALIKVNFQYLTFSESFLAILQGSFLGMLLIVATLGGLFSLFGLTFNAYRSLRIGIHKVKKDWNGNSLSERIGKNRKRRNPS